MPHLSIEYSSGLEEDGALIERLCRALHSAMLEAGIFPVAGIRVRAYRADYAIVADGHPDNDFAAMTLNVGSGRSTEALQEAGALIFGAAQKVLSQRLAEPHFALSLEIRVMNPALSWKDTPIHSRLTKKD